MPDEAAILASSAGSAYEWNDFFSRVLPQNGSDSCIANEDYPEQLFDVCASDAARTASLCALGWPDGHLPGKKVLLEHMLKRVEYEYADHLFSHSYEPGEWCDECQCICARVDGDDSESDSADDDDDCVDDVCAEDPADDVDDWAYLYSSDDETDFPAGSCSAGPTA